MLSETYAFGVNDGVPSTALAAIEAAQPTELASLTTASTTLNGPSAISTGGDSAVTVPTDPAQPVTISSSTAESAPVSVAANLPFGSQAGNAHAEAVGVVSYDNENGSLTVPVVKNDGSVILNTVITQASAPTTYNYPVNVPSGGSLTLDSASGAVTVLDSSGNYVGGVAAAWAKDASGAAVPTHYVVNGNTLQQVVDLSSTAIKYPVVADPWLGIRLISHATWENVGKWSPTLAVVPTTYGRYGAPAIADWAAWAEVIKLFPNSNSPSMKTQFYCHFDFVRIYSPNKPSWDLDQKRPNTTLSNELNHKCNYPDGGKEW